MSTCTIRRMYQNNIPDRIIKTGVTLEEAKNHCNDPETSSSTCSTPENLEHLRKYGPWFDGYDED